MFQSLRTSLNDWQTSVEAQVTNSCSQADLEVVCENIWNADMQVVYQYAALDVSAIISMLDLGQIDEQLLVTDSTAYIVRGLQEFMYICPKGIQ
jgi:hypothetical protein